MTDHEKEEMARLCRQLDDSEAVARLRKQLADAREPILQAQEQFRQMMEPTQKAQERMREIMEPFEQIRAQMAGTLKPIQNYIDDNRLQIQRLSLNINEKYATFAADLKRLMPPPEVMQRWAKAGSQNNRLAEAGWLPHQSFLFLLEDETSVSNGLSDAIESYWRDNWTDIEASFIGKFDSFDVDQEAKLTFREALSAHRQGHYRSVCRMLFPEFERIARYELHGGELKGLTSLRKFRELAGSLEIEKANKLGGLSVLRLFNALFDHLYTRVENEEELEKVRGDAVPNRHACLHGIISYNSPKNSANMLIMADFIYQIVTILKSIKSEEEG